MRTRLGTMCVVRGRRARLPLLLYAPYISGVSVPIGHDQPLGARSVTVGCVAPALPPPRRAPDAGDVMPVRHGTPAQPVGSSVDSAGLPALRDVEQ